MPFKCLKLLLNSGVSIHGSDNKNLAREGVHKPRNKGWMCLIYLCLLHWFIKTFKNAQLLFKQNLNKMSNIYYALINAEINKNTKVNTNWSTD